MKKLLTKVFTLSLLVSSFSLTNKLNAVKASDANPLPTEVDELIYDADGYSVYGSSSQEIVTTGPEGFDGKVMHVLGGSGNPGDSTGVGLYLDFSSFKISTDEIDSIVFKAYGGGPEWRVSKNSAWIMRVTNSVNSWNTITLSSSSNFQAGKSFSNISEDGYLSTFEFCNNHVSEMWIDSIVVKLKDHSKDEVLKEIPVVDPISGITAMSYTNIEYLSNEAALANNVPKGYTGSVIKISGRDSGGGLGITLDYSKENIMTSRIESISFRIYMLAGDCKEIRLTANAGSSFLVRYVPQSNEQDCWFDFTIKNDGTNLYTGMSLCDISSSSILKQFNFGIRTNSGKNGPLYIDSVTVTYKEINFEDEFPIVESISGVSAYPTDMPMYYTDEEASSMGVPTGSSTGVLKVTSTTANMGVTFDFSNKHIKTYAIESLSIRYYLVKTGSETASYPEARITNCGGQGSNAWALRHLMGTEHLDEWYTLTINRDGTNFYSSLGFDYFKNDNGEVGAFEFSIRNVKPTTLYIDYITFNMREADTVAPIITYKGPREFSIPYGREIITDATAFDEYQNGNVNIYYEWEENAYDNGILKFGTWICYLCAKDDAGNVASLPLTITILEPDTEAPVIHANITTIRCKEGSIPQLNVVVTDNIDEVLPTYTWSEGALDNYGRLVKGTHQVTISATDLSNNTATKTITFIVE